jgi:predicted nucleotidyltransferase component of viral defense system
MREKLTLFEPLLLHLVENKVLPRDSYLAGGTAVYFYLRHRFSADLDFFTPKPFSGEALLFRVRELVKDADVEILERDTLIANLTLDRLKFSMFYLPYDLLSPLVPYELKAGVICPLASIDDIEAMKAVALVQRGSAKDFIDLYSLLRHTGHSFPDLASRVYKKYQVDQKYDYHLKRAMVYFDDAERELGTIWLVGDKGTPQNISTKDWKNIKGFCVRFCQ